MRAKTVSMISIVIVLLLGFVLAERVNLGEIAQDSISLQFVHPHEGEAYRISKYPQIYFQMWSQDVKMFCLVCERNRMPTLIAIV